MANTLNQNKVNPELMSPFEIGKGEFNKLAILIDQQVNQRYEGEKGVFRKYLSVFYKPIAHSSYLDDLIKFNNQLQSAVKTNKQLSMQDMSWLYEKCYSPSGEHSSLSGGSSLSSRVYRTIRSALNNAYPQGYEDFKDLKDKAQTEAREYVAKKSKESYRPDENIYTFEGRNPGFVDILKDKLSKTILWPAEKANVASLRPDAGTSPSPSLGANK